MDKRGSGILLHVTSLPSEFGIGDLGPRAYEFADFLARSKQRYWQILPLTPTDHNHGDSPYHGHSAFAFNPMLISPELLIKDNRLRAEDLNPVPDFPGDRVDYGGVIPRKKEIFYRVYEQFQNEGKGEDYEAFCRMNAHWLDDYALFVAIKSYFQGKVWSAWPPEFRERDPEALRRARSELEADIEKACFLQYLFYSQWMKLKTYCSSKNIRIIGDIPIYVVYDSADVWAHPELFHLDDDKKPQTVAGVPPDYFSETGQLWGNPVYRWEALQTTGYDWWVRRIRHNLELYDIVRIDHFRGFVGYWEIPASEENAVNGRWVEAPAWDFFNRISEAFPRLPIIAEDLGIITPDVHKVMDHFRFPGMKVLLFAFGDDLPTNPYAPHNLERDCVLYTGTHDNNTARGWFEKEAGPEVRERIFRYIGREVTSEQIPRELVRLAMMSVANTVIFPLQDLLCLGETARMNHPGTREGNWAWRLEPGLLTDTLSTELGDMTEIFGRSNR